jgi:hypothetical protein
MGTNLRVLGGGSIADTLEAAREYRRKPGEGPRPFRSACQARYTGISGCGVNKGCFRPSGKPGWRIRDEVSGIDWIWLSADGCMTKVPLALETVGNNPTDRGANAICR